MVSRSLLNNTGKLVPSVDTFRKDYWYFPFWPFEVAMVDLYCQALLHSIGMSSIKRRPHKCVHSLLWLTVFDERVWLSKVM